MILISNISNEQYFIPEKYDGALIVGKTNFLGANIILLRIKQISSIKEHTIEYKFKEDVCGCDDLFYEKYKVGDIIKTTTWDEIFESQK